LDRISESDDKVSFLVRLCCFREYFGDCHGRREKRFALHAVCICAGVLCIEEFGMVPFPRFPTL
jgi:hypothetical protein